MPWQQHVADVVFELNAEGNLHYDRVVVTVPRQAGKTTLIVPVIVHRSVAEFPGNRLDVGPQRQSVVYTAQNRNAARQKWIEEFIPLIDDSAFHPMVEIRLANGSEGFDWENGSRFGLTATTKKSGHGPTLDLGIIDEAFAQPDDRVEQAMEPAMITRLSSQLWILSTAGDTPEESPFLWAEVEAGRRRCLDPRSRSAYFEWSCDPETDDLDDIEVIASRHPAVGHTITVADLDAKRQAAVEKGDLSGFLRAYANVWGAAEEQHTSKIPADRWASTLTAADIKRRFTPATTLAFDVARDGEWSSISVGAGTITEPFVQCVQHAKGVGWLPAALVDWVAKINPPAVGYNSAGPVASQIAAVLDAFNAAGLDANLLHPFNSGEYKAACGGFYTDVVEGRLHHPAAGQAPLDAAALDATERPLVDAFAWAQRTEPISPLTSATLARALLPVEAVADKPVFMY
jgi:hypothetical protein